MKNEFVGFGRLLRLYIGVNKTLLLFMIFLPLLLAYGAAASNMSVLRTPEALSDYIGQSMASPVSLGMLGPIMSDTMAGVTLWRTRVSILLFAAIFSIAVVVRCTRKEEELGRLELLRAVTVGRKASLAAALAIAFAANAAGGLLMAVGFVASGFPAAGSFAAGLAAALASCFFAGAAGIASQLASSARTANVISYAVLGTALVFQVFGNFQEKPGGIFYLSPFSWVTIARPYAGEQYGVYIAGVLLVLLLAAVAFRLLSGRDVGAGLFPDRAGRRFAKPGFDNPYALAWRLQKGMLFGWILGYAVLGALVGSLVVTIESMFADNEALSGWIVGLGGSGDAFVSFLLYILAQVASAYAIIAVLVLRTEENEQRAEPLLATAVGRVKWAAGHLLFAFGGTVVVLAALGAGAGWTASVVTNDSGEFARFFMSSLGKLPAVWVVASIPILLYGWLPKLATAISWTAVGVFMAIEFLWELRAVGDGVFRLSPFYYVYPTSGIAAGPLSVLAAIAAAAAVVGMIGFRRREIGH